MVRLGGRCQRPRAGPRLLRRAGAGSLRGSTRRSVRAGRPRTRPRCRPAMRRGTPPRVLQEARPPHASASHRRSACTPCAASRCGAASRKSGAWRWAPRPPTSWPSARATPPQSKLAAASSQNAATTGARVPAAPTGSAHPIVRESPRTGLLESGSPEFPPLCSHPSRCRRPRAGTPPRRGAGRAPPPPAAGLSRSRLPGRRSRAAGACGLGDARPG
mmetsp:Transcript_73700/g.216292  ORF Transcript_73700/g.216292 Transcript_73700/m.216292 type:complete len:217 (+) Transcript_73700:429-1079(+)